MWFQPQSSFKFLLIRSGPSETMASVEPWLISPDCWPLLPTAVTEPCTLHSMWACCRFYYGYYLHVCLSCLALSSLGGLMPTVFRVCRKPSPLHHWQTTVYLCSEGLYRLFPCQHECDQIHDSVTAMSLGDLQTVRWFGMSQERDRTHLLGKIYLSAERRKW